MAIDLQTLQQFVADAGRSWNRVTVLDEHVAPDVALNLCRARSAVLVRNANVVELARGLAGWRRTLVVAENLGGPTERRSTVDPAEAVARLWRSPELLCLADTEFAVEQEGWALPDDRFANRDGLVANAEVRALALARLAPRPGVLVWDVGAGPGAVGVECARLGAAVLAVERNPVQVVRIIANAAAHHVDVRVVEAELAEAINDLPRPDAVFVGGGGAAAVAACAKVGAKRIVVAMPELDRIVAARDALRDAGYAVEGSLLSSARLVGSVTVATNPVTVLWGTRA
jgi:precorrin-6Y C5,15-methyltransferase (decarboxylating)